MAFYRGANVVTDGLVLSLDAGNVKSYPGSGTAWGDLTGRGNNGTLTNGPTFSSANAGSIVFDGTNDFVGFPSEFNATTAGLNSYHSVEMWVYPYRVNSSNDGLFRCLRQLATNQYLHYIIRNSKFYLAWYNADVSGNTTIFPNRWYNVVYLFDNDNKQKIYINGSLDVESQVRLSTFDGATSTIQLGFYTSYYQGLISTTRVYNRSLRAEEVAQNFNAIRGRYGI